MFDQLKELVTLLAGEKKKITDILEEQKENKNGESAYPCDVPPDESVCLAFRIKSPIQRRCFSK